jgi:glutaminase
MTTQEPRIAPVDPISAALGVLVGRARQHTGGTVADYIPELATADPEDVGVAVVSVLGRIYAAGDSGTEFTIQSVSKPFVYALAVADHGLDEVLRHVGSEPSGEPFNAISLDDDGRPANPMINAGAIVTTSLVRPAADGTRFGRILGVLSAFAGRELAVDETVYQSELSTGHRNRALAHLSLASGVLVGAVDAATEDYFRQCSVRVTVVDLAIMAATLANAGTNPVTGVRVVDARTARHAMSMMASCGMYDHAGDWGLRVGLPAKSGVSGGIVAVTSGQFGIGVHSPPLDVVGNSVRGVAALTELSDRFGLHMLEHPGTPVSPIDRIAVDGSTLQLRLRGEIDFIAAEQLVHTIRTADRAGRATAAVTRVELHLDDATQIEPIADLLLATALSNAVALGFEAVVVDPADVLRPLEGHGGQLAAFRESDD